MKKLFQARADLIVKHSYFLTTALRIKFVEANTDSFELIGTTLFYSADFVENKSEEELVDFLLEVVMTIAGKATLVKPQQRF